MMVGSISKWSIGIAHQRHLFPSALCRLYSLPFSWGSSSQKTAAASHDCLLLTAAGTDSRKGALFGHSAKTWVTAWPGLPGYTSSDRDVPKEAVEEGRLPVPCTCTTHSLQSLIQFPSSQYNMQTSWHKDLHLASWGCFTKVMGKSIHFLVPLGNTDFVWSKPYLKHCCWGCSVLRKCNPRQWMSPTQTTGTKRTYTLLLLLLE